MAMSYLLQIRQGDTKKLTIQYQQEDGDPVDVTDCTFELFISSDGTSHTYIGSPEIVVDDPTTGVIQLTLSSVETTALSKNSASYWLRLTDASGTQTTLLKGSLDVDEL